MKKEEYKISIIVPIYNLELYVIQLIQMVKNQTYSNFECILVNDGSIDKSEEIIKENIYGDNRFVLISQINQGVSVARNTGLKYASGDYVCFIDGDDYIEADFLEKCNHYLENNIDSDMLSFGIKLVNENNEVLRTIIPPNYDGIEKKFMKSEITASSLCCKVIKRNIFIEHKIELPTGMIMNEDYITSFMLFFYSKNIVYADDIYYLYLQRSTSCTKNHTEKHIISMLSANEMLNSFAEKNNIDISRLMSYRKLKIYSLYITDRNLFNPKIFRDAISLEIIKVNKEYISKFEKIYFYLAKSKFDLFCYFICINQNLFRKLLKI